MAAGLGETRACSSAPSAPRPAKCVQHLSFPCFYGRWRGQIPLLLARVCRCLRSAVVRLFGARGAKPAQISSPRSYQSQDKSPLLRLPCPHSSGQKRGFHRGCGGVATAIFHFWLLLSALSSPPADKSRVALFSHPFTSLPFFICRHIGAVLCRFALVLQMVLLSFFIPDSRGPRWPARVCVRGRCLLFFIAPSDEKTIKGDRFLGRPVGIGQKYKSRKGSTSFLSVGRVRAFVDFVHCFFLIALPADIVVTRRCAAFLSFPSYYASHIVVLWAFCFFKLVSCACPRFWRLWVCRLLLRSVLSLRSISSFLSFSLAPLGFRFDAVLCSAPKPFVLVSSSYLFVCHFFFAFRLYGFSLYVPRFNSFVSVSAVSPATRIVPF